MCGLITLFTFAASSIALARPPRRPNKSHSSPVASAGNDLWIVGKKARPTIVVTGPKGMLGLTGFSLSYHGIDDHEVGRIVVEHDGKNQTRLALADDAGNRRIYGSVQLQVLPSGTRILEASQAKCQGTCAVPIQPPRPGETFVLRGFAVGRTGGDTHLRELSITPKVEDGRVLVTFADNGTPEFNAKVQYAYVPDAWIEGTYHSVVDQQQASNAGLHGHRVEGRTVMQGFSLQFTNGDHHIRTVRLQRDQVDWSGMIADSDTHDPKKIVIDYVRLRTTPVYETDKKMPTEKSKFPGGAPKKLPL
jgi:hypothetical protein